MTDFKADVEVALSKLPISKGIAVSVDYRPGQPRCLMVTFTKGEETRFFAIDAREAEIGDLDEIVHVRTLCCLRPVYKERK